MEERTKKFFDEIEKYINKVINKDELMKKNIKYMYRHPNCEWYNIAAVLLQNPAADTVMSVSAFKKLCNDTSLCPKLGKKAYRVAVPEINKSGNLTYNLLPVFDISDLNKPVVTDNETPLRKKIEKYGGATAVTMLLNRYTTLEEIVTAVIVNNYNSYISKEELERNKEVIKNCIMFSLGRVFNVNPNLNTCFNVKENTIGMYSYVKYLIDVLPEELTKVIESLNIRTLNEEKERKLELIFNRNIRQRVIDAKSKIINENEEIDIPPPEDESLIYQGDYDL